ncbi:UvrD-like helicase carboxy-terminal domain protein, putative [Rhizoctonia solani AG-3 Rhs1AP]|uniref:UvrD-like helicase carboxy-terminal domain protein, putative n=1 Tax=Rhizoctonia solani AG-3 Rhs1AP TaxID=1086054 RepID=X8J010_9AGAM|nr:UvrD-like helicase carboxy-terminal domain protein, putative [Rhizoctonia solani AG-3 Rhs1AP]
MDPSPTGTRWAVMMASRADKQLRKLEQEKNMLDITWTKIEELHSGQFTEDNHTAIIGTTDWIPIYRARVSGDLRIIYQIDISPEPSLKYDHQVIKVLYVDSRAQIDYGFWVQVSKSLYQRAYRDEYRDRCIFRIQKSHTNSFVYLPAKYSHDDRMFTHEPVYLLDNHNGTEDRNKACIPVRLERFFPVNKALYNSILANVELNLPIVLDPLERAIVHNKKASIVIGRSGTGKTTALVYKLRAIHLQPQAKSLRQMVVTRSRVLAKHVEATFRSLIESTSIAEKTATELSALAEQHQQQSGPALIEFDSELDLREDLPSRFSLLEDSHFPLFISFNKLCLLLEGDLLIHERGQQQCKVSTRDDNVIDYNKFHFEYWPKFDRTQKIGLGPAFVYSEIMGVIKGSSHSLGNADGYLSMDQYLGSVVGRKAATSQLNEGLRAQIYAIFEHYRKLKGERFERDSADMTRSLLKFITDTKMTPSQDQPLGTWSTTSLVDFLYVDEVQDNLMIDVHLLKALCKSVRNTYWGGDTAQTIVAGSAFRIRDLATYLFNEGPSVTSKHSTSSPIFSKFDLVGNFRSHTGIVDCAASIIKALYKLFPNSLDQMEPETARWKGPPPVVFKDAGPDLSSFEQFLLSSGSGSGTSFGAQQAIIVRSESIVEDLNSRLADLCPIISITDCKGLEFDDVLIYNFFSSSETPEAWDFVHDTPLRTHRNVQESAPPPSLCAELKLLYVAITRARKRCWIWDHGHVRNAMQLFWVSQGLVTTASVSEIADWSVISTPAEWAGKGQEYFANKMYRLAASCFERGRQDLKARTASAYHQMSRAKIQMLRGDSRESRSKLREATKALDQCAKDEYTAGQTQSARHLWYHAATCLELAHETREAAKMFVAAGHPERAIRSLFGKGLMNDGLRLFLANRKKLETAVEEELLEYCRSYYFNKLDYGFLPPLFDFDLQEQISYARRNNLRPQLEHILKENKLFVELARLHLEERKLENALDCFLDDLCEYGRSSSLGEGVEVAIGYAENIFGLETKKSPESLKRLKSMLNKLKPHKLALQPRHTKELSLFHDLLDNYQAVDWTWADKWDQSNPEERIRKSIILHLALSNMDWLVSQSSTNDYELRSLLEAWKTYNALIAPIFEVADPSRLPIAQQLLGFRPSRPDLYINTHFIVSEESVVYECSKQQRVPIQRNSHGDMLFPARWVDKLIRDGLGMPLDRRLRRFYDRLDPKNRNSLGTYTLKSYNITVPSKSMSASYPGYLDRLRAVLIVLDLISPICHARLDSPQSGKPGPLQIWIRCLFDILYPGNGMIGDLELDSICTSSRQSLITGLRTCVKEFLKEIDSSTNSNIQFSSLIVGYSLAIRLVTHDLGTDMFKFTHLNAHTSSAIAPPSMHSPLTGDLISSIFDSNDATGLTKAANVIRNASEASVDPVDLTTLVPLIEFITCDMIFHIRRGLMTGHGFPSLILPFSWARLLAERYCSTHKTPARDVGSLPDFLKSIIFLSEELRFNSARNWLIGGTVLPKQSDMVQTFKLRLCWCIAFFLVNSNHQLDTADPIISSLIHVSGDEHGRVHKNSCQRFSLVFDQETCVQALCQTFRHESIVLLSDGKEDKPEWCYHPEIGTVTYSDSTSI